MFKKSAAFLAVIALAACASGQPRVIQSSSDNTDIILKTGQVTQIEMPDQGHVQSIMVGNPDLVSAEQADDVVNLTVKQGAGETNMIIRAREDGEIKVYQYHIIVTTR